MSEITAAYAKARVSYDPATGVFTRLVSSGKSRAGSVANRPNQDGYEVVSLFGLPVLAHRLAWLLATGKWPVYAIDHIDGNRANNVWSNLREVAAVVNSQNQRQAHADSFVGLLGVSRHGKSGFQARIQVHGKTRFLGTHKTPQAAHEAYLEAKRALHEGCTL